MKTQSRAPVAIFAFKRLDLLRQTLQSLERCEGFDGTPLYIFSDAAKTGTRSEAGEVARLRSWLRKWASAHGAVMHEEAENVGLRKSITTGVGTVLESHDRIIVLEDDLVLSRWFLTFMNEALESFADRADVFQISGYFVPTSRKLASVGMLRAPGSWGWATWRRAWQHYRDDATQLLLEVSRRDTHAFDMNGTYSFLEVLRHNAEGSLNTWHVRWYASMFLLDGLALYPGMSLTRNVGFDKRGTHTNSSSGAQLFRRQRIVTAKVSIPDSRELASESADFVSVAEEFNRWQQHQWTKPRLFDRIRARARIITDQMTAGRRSR